MFEMTEALQQMLDRNSAMVAMEIETSRATSPLTIEGDMASRGGAQAPWKITWETVDA